YPLFAFGFLVWIAAATPQRRLGSAVGWFWFAFTGGLPTLGSLIASFLIPLIGAFNTFWVALGLVVLGALVALLGVRERIGSRPLAVPGTKPLATLLSSISIGWKKPKIGIGCIVRTINTSSEYGFLVFMPIFFTLTLGFSLGAWLRFLSIMFLSNIIWNLLFGIIGDKLGWRKTVAYFGGVGCAITTLALYYVPVTFRGDYSLVVLIGILYGATLAGYVPLSALMPSLAPKNKGAAMSLLNLGAGASAWVGPAIVGIFIGPFGVVGVMWIYAVLYVISAILVLFLTLPPEVEAAIVQDPRRSGFRAAAFAAGGTLLGHPPAMPANLAGDSHIDLITFDLGGTIYDDNCYAQALLRAVHELHPELVESDFWKVYDTQLGRSYGSLRTELSRRFEIDREHLNELTRKYWEYPPSSLYPDVLPTLTTLASSYRLGIVADAPVSSMEALRRDGLDKLFTVIAISDVVGMEKPDPRLYQYVLDKAGVRADRTVHVGNRLDLDIRPARRLGMYTVWVPRGEVPPAPTPEQFAEADAVVMTLVGLPTALARLIGDPTRLSA
ncbi:MAG TPA: MFS transporter, partial [Ktedonobacteraceae bacterium]|nr:MFS transporter [Ktedonobacteraceae bacterium]